MLAMSLLTRAARYVLALGLVLATLSASPAHAETCTLSGPNGTFKVAEIPFGDYPLSVSWSQKDPIPPLVTDSTYTTAQGLWVFYDQGIDADAYVVSMASKSAPRGKIEVGGMRLVDAPVPMPWGVGLHGAEYAITDGGYSGAGYIVAYGTGASSGANGTGQWTFGVSVPCTIIDVPGEIININQTHFSGTQVYAPSAGYGSNLRLDFPRYPQYDAMLGMIYARANGGTATVRSGGQPLVGTGTPKALIEISGSPRVSGFTLEADYAGVDPLINLNAVLADLPF